MRSSIVAAAVFALALAGCSGPANQWTGLAHPDTLAKAGMKYYWTGRARLQPGEKLVKIYRLDENLYCQTSGNRIIAIDAATGITKWVFQSNPDETIFRPVHYDGVKLTPEVSGILQLMEPGKLPNVPPFNALMINTESYVVVLNRDTGEVIRRPNAVAFGFAADCAGTTDGVNYYVGTTDGRYAAFRLQEGIKIWTMSSSDKKEPISAPLKYLNRQLFVANDGGTMLCADVSRISKVNVDWSAQLEGHLRAEFQVDDRGCFVPCWDNRLYGFNTLTGQKLWEPVVCRGVLNHAVQVGQNSLFQYAQQDKLYAVDIATGRVRWSIPDRQNMLVLGSDAGNVWIKDGRNNLQVVNEMSGGKVVSLPLTGHELFVSNATLPVIYTAKANGRIFCIAPTATTRINPEMLHKVRRAAATKPATLPAAPAATPSAAPSETQP